MGRKAAQLVNNGIQRVMTTIELNQPQIFVFGHFLPNVCLKRHTTVAVIRQEGNIFSLRI